jgi:hypothetical protein
MLVEGRLKHTTTIHTSTTDFFFVSRGGLDAAMSTSTSGVGTRASASRVASFTRSSRCLHLVVQILYCVSAPVRSASIESSVPNSIPRVLAALASSYSSYQSTAKRKKHYRAPSPLPIDAPSRPALSMTPRHRSESQQPPLQRACRSKPNRP